MPRCCVTSHIVLQERVSFKWKELAARLFSLKMSLGAPIHIQMQWQTYKMYGIHRFCYLGLGCGWGSMLIAYSLVLAPCGVPLWWPPVQAILRKASGTIQGSMLAFHMTVLCGFLLVVVDVQQAIAIGNRLCVCMYVHMFIYIYEYMYQILYILIHSNGITIKTVIIVFIFWWFVWIRIALRLFVL